MRIRRLRRLETRIQELEAQQPPPPDPLLPWMSTLSNEDVDLLAAAAERVKAGDPMRFDSPDLQRLETDFQAFMER